MFLTTSGAALTGSSITALSQVINNNNNTNTTSSSTFSAPKSAASLSPQLSQSKSSSIKSKFTRGRKENALTTRPGTSTSITSATSSTSPNLIPSSAIRATSVASSVTSSIANRASISSTTNTTPASTPATTPALSAKSTPPISSPGGNSIQDPFEQVDTACDSTEPQPRTSLSETTADNEGSMRRRATESIGSNLIANSLRAVFRDNNTSASDNVPSGPPAQSPTEELASLRLDDTSMTRNLPTNSSLTTSGNTAGNAGGKASNATEMPSIKFIPHQDQRSSRPSLAFAPMTRTLPAESSVIRVGRYSERDNSPNANIVPSSAPIGFKSKVVSRRHCEFWCSNGQWYVKDVKSSSGTFLNHIRLSQPSTESKPFPINDGDIVQLGMDFRGGEESIFRCVKIRIEVNRGWQKKLNDFNTTTHKALRALSKEASTTNSTECSICLMSISPCQALFVAPCSHVWHYKCIRPVINNPKMYPQFLCPNCRAVTDLEADIDEVVDGWDEAEAGEANVGGAENRSATPINVQENGEDDQSSAPNNIPEASAAAVPEIHENHGINHTSGISNQELQDTTIIFSEPSAIHIRDPRTIPDTLEGVVTPRNEAGPFVFDGSGRRVEAPIVST